MSHSVLATAKTPALIIYLLDCSGSMTEMLDGKSRIDHVNEALENILVRMVQRSTRGEVVSPRYRLAMIAYNTQPYDLLGGIKAIDEVVRKGKPRLNATGTTDTAGAFAMARDLLRQELPNLADHPAPMICHLTDGEYTTGDPEPIAQEIMQMSNKDGNVLIENIFVNSDLTHAPIGDLTQWPGLKDQGELRTNYAQTLFRMSSPLPASYANEIGEEGYAIQAGARMLIPGADKGLIQLAFDMSGATPTR